MKEATLKKFLVFSMTILVVFIIIYLFVAITEWRNAKSRTDKDADLRSNLEVDMSELPANHDMDFADNDDENREISAKMIDQGKAIGQVNQFINYINDNNHSAAYDMLNSDYTNQFSVTYELFQSKYSYSSDIQILVKDFYDYEDRFIINCMLFEETAVNSLEDDFSDSEIPSKPVSFTILKSYDANNLIDMGIISVEESNFIDKIESLVLSIDNIYKMTDGLCLTISIENTGTEAIELRKSNNSITVEAGNSYYRHHMYERRISNYTIEAGSTNHYTLFFPVSIKAQDEGIILHIKLDDNTTLKSSKFDINNHQ